VERCRAVVNVPRGSLIQKQIAKLREESLVAPSVAPVRSPPEDFGPPATEPAEESLSRLTLSRFYPLDWHLNPLTGVRSRTVCGAGGFAAPGPCAVLPLEPFWSVNRFQEMMVNSVLFGWQMASLPAGTTVFIKGQKCTVREDPLVEVDAQDLEETATLLRLGIIETGTIERFDGQEWQTVRCTFEIGTPAGLRFTPLKSLSNYIAPPEENAPPKYRRGVLVHGDLDPRLAGHDIGEPFHVVGYGDDMPCVQMRLIELAGASGWARLVNMSVEALKTAILVLRDRKSAIDQVVLVVDKVYKHEGMFYVKSDRLYMKGVRGQLQPGKTDIQIYSKDIVRLSEEWTDAATEALEEEVSNQMALETRLFCDAGGTGRRSAQTR
ncbi:unnamed protein product, partial [Symbiodinium sp. KB8]